MSATKLVALITSLANECTVVLSYPWKTRAKDLPTELPALYQSLLDDLLSLTIIAELIV